MKIAVITSRFNQEITEALKLNALTRLKERGIDASQIATFDVPGAIEIPLIAKLCAKKNIFDAIICLGAVIRGDTSHYDYVCEQVSVGCQKIMLDYDVPVIFGVLTTENEQQAINRIQGAREHVDAALEMIALTSALNAFHF